MSDDYRQMDPEREKALEEALEEAWDKGLSPLAMEILIYETGSRWTPAKQQKAA